MKIKFRSNRVCGIAAAVFAVILWFIIPIQIVDASRKMIKADFLPKMMTIVIFISGIWLIVQSFLKPEKDKIVVLDLQEEGRVLIYMAVLVLYIFLFNKIGFLLSTLVLAMFTLFFVKEKKWHYYLITAIYVIVVFTVFRFALGVSLPTLFLK